MATGSLRNIASAILFAVLAMTVSMPVSAEAEAPTADIGQNSSRIRLGVFESKGMYELAADGEVIGGFCYEYMMQISNYTGWDYEFVYGSFAQLYDMLRNGQIDILPYTNWSSRRSDEILFSSLPLIHEEYYIAGKPDSAGTGNGSRLADGAVISALADADYNTLLEEYLRSTGINAETVYGQYVNDIWDDVRTGRADATIWTSVSYSDDDWNILGYLGKKPTYIGISKCRPDLKERIDEASDLIDKESPALKEELVIKYFHSNPIRRNLSQEEQEWISAHPVLHIGCFTNDAPYILLYDNEKRTAQGLTPSIVSAIIERLGLDITADYQCFATMDEIEVALDSGLIDVIAPFYPSHHIAQKHNLVSSNVISTTTMDLIFPKNSNYTQAIEKIAVQNTKLGQFYLEDNFPNSQAAGTQSIHGAVDMVANGEATGALAQTIITDRLLEEYNNLTCMVLPNGCSTCFAARLKDYPIIRILNRGLLFIPQAEISALAAQYSGRMPVSVREFLASHRAITVHLILLLIVLIALGITTVRLFMMKRKADAANRAKTTFLFNMSHDLRTPMNAIMGFTSMAKKEIGDPEKACGLLEKIEMSGHQLLVLINQALEMSRLDSGSIVFNRKPVNLQKQYESFVTMLSEQAKSRGISFNHQLKNITHTKVLADDARVGQVVLHIVGNAIKFTQQGGQIDFSLCETEPRKSGYATYIFSVADNGIGMSEDFQKVLFEPFTRERNSTESHANGTGLGMAIVKRLIDLTGGSITVKSQPGKGTSYAITIDLMIDNKVTATAQGTQTRYDGKRVLLVDDNKMNREIARYILEDKGMTVEEATDGNFAVSMVGNAFSRGDYMYYDLIVMDIQMPTLNGYDATRAIRRICESAQIHIPIVALSANSFEEDRRKSREAGMDEHLAKPIDPDILNEVLAQFL